MKKLLILLALAACDDSPHWQMAGAEMQRVTIGGHDYSVYRLDKTFEVVRHGYAPRSEQDRIFEDMLTAVAQVTGCTPNRISGDSGEMRGKLTSCPRSRS